MTKLVPVVAEPNQPWKRSERSRDGKEQLPTYCHGACDGEDQAYVSVHAARQPLGLPTSRTLTYLSSNIFAQMLDSPSYRLQCVGNGCIAMVFLVGLSPLRVLVVDGAKVVENLR
jgi:hypothetical protein